MVKPVKNPNEMAKSLVNFSNKEDFLRKHGLNKYYEFDGGDLVDLDDMSTTSVYVGDDGWDEENLLNEIESLGKWSRDPKKIKQPVVSKVDDQLDKLQSDPKYWASKVLQDPREYSEEERTIAQWIKNKWGE